MGLSWHGDQLEATHLRLRWNTIEAITSCRVPIEDSLEHAIDHLLSDLISPASMPKVVMAFGGAYPHMRLAVREAPVLEDLDLLEEWAESEAEQILPPGAAIEHFNIENHIIYADEDQVRCAICVTPLSWVKMIEDVAEKLGVNLVSLGCPDLDLIYALSYQPGFQEGTKVVISRWAEHASILLSKDGIVSDMSTIEFEGPDLQANLFRIGQDLQEKLDGAGGNQLWASPDEIWVSGDEAEEIAAALTGADISSAPIRPVHIKLGDKVIEEGGALSLGSFSQALKAGYAFLGGLNLVDAEKEKKGRQDIDKADALKSILMLGAFIALLLVGLTGSDGYLASKLEESQEQLVDLKVQDAEVRQIEKDLDILKEQVSQAEAVVRERTATAGLMQILSDRMPATAWLENMAVTRSEGNQWKARVEGYSMNERSIGQFLSGLELHQHIKSVGLDYTETVRADRIYVEVSDPLPVTKFGLDINFEL